MATSPLAADRLAPLTAEFQRVLIALGEHSTPHLQALWAKLPNYDEPQVERFAREATPFLTAAKLVAVRHAVGYYSLAAGTSPIAVPIDAIAVNADMREPFISIWNALKHGEPFDSAVAAGSGRVDAVVRNLVTSSARRTGDLVIGQSGRKFHGWRRIPDAHACPWCIQVAGQRYKTAESADFGHDRCGCTAQPVFA